MDMDMNVLIVDDFSTMRRILKKGLKEMGFKNLVEAEDGKDALNELKNGNYGLIISDWNMPNMDGLDLLRAVRADENLKKIPFVMVTAEGQRENVLEAVKEGVNNYVVKPFTSDTLFEKIKKAFE